MKLHYLDLYEKLKNDYVQLADNDINGAFQIKTRAASLQETIATTMQQVEKDVNNNDAYVKSIYAKKIAEISPKNVSMGKVQVLANEAYLATVKDHNQLTYYLGLISVHHKFLEKVYFDCKAQWERGNKIQHRGV